MTTPTRSERFAVLTPYVVAGLAGLLLVTPQLLFPRTLPEGAFHQMSFSETDEEGFYYARVREAQDGHFGIRNAYSAEYKDKPILHMGLLEIAFGLVGRSTGLHIDALMILVKLLLGVLAFLAIFHLSLAMTGDRLVAVASAATVLFGLDAVFRPWLIPREYFDPAHATFLFYSRPIQPAGGAIFLFGTVASLLHFRRTGNKTAWLLFAGLLAASFYVYIFTWTFLLAYLGLVILVFLWRRDYAFFREVAIALGIALASASYLFFQLWLAVHDPDYASVATRFGGVGNRYPILGLLAPASALLVVFYRLNARWLVVPLYLTPLVVLNQQIVTGRTLHTGHYHWYYNEPLFLLMGLALGHQLLRRREALHRFSFGGLVVAAFALGAAQQVAAYQRFHDVYVERQALGEVYQWLDENTPKDSVVLAEEIAYLAGYTHNNSYLSVPWTLVPQERLIEDYFVRKAFFERSDELFPETPPANREMAMEVFAGHYHEDCEVVEARRLDISYPCYDDARLRPLLERYRGRDREHALELVAKHRLDYVLMPKPVTNALLRGRELLFENEAYALYRWSDRGEVAHLLRRGAWSAADRSCYRAACWPPPRSLE